MDGRSRHGRESGAGMGDSRNGGMGRQGERSMRTAILDAVASVACYMIAGTLLVTASEAVGITDRYLVTLLLDFSTIAVLARGTGKAAWMPGGIRSHPRLSRGAVAALAVMAFALVWMAGVSGSGAVSLALSGGAASAVSYADAFAGTSPAIGIALQLLVAPVAEELLVRGRAYGKLRDVLPMPVATIMSSVLFAAMHGTLFHLPTTLLLGAFLACLYEGTGSLATCMIAHATANALTLSLAQVEAVPAGLLSPAAAVALSIAAIAAVVALGRVVCEARTASMAGSAEETSG